MMKKYLRKVSIANNKRKFNHKEKIRVVRYVSRIHNQLERATTGAAGYDLYSVEDAVIKAGEKKLVDTGLRLDIPNGMYGQIQSRSGIALYHDIFCLNGVIDNDYRGSIKVLMINMGKKDFRIEKEKNRIAQIIFIKNEHPVFMKRKRLRQRSNRKKTGFGSTDQRERE